jgi:hypothetical protein
MKVPIPKWSNKVDISIPDDRQKPTFVARLNLEKLGWTTNFKRHLGIVRNMYVKMDKEPH